MICKSSIRSQLNYGNIIYNQAYNASFQQKSFKYNAALVITEAKRKTSKEKPFE